MTYYIQNRDGKVYKGKSVSGKWNEVWRGIIEIWHYWNNYYDKN